ncbi:hypothetical protein [Streptomyces geranii]|uniref:hypothetical protein n=1 Tax=Streptomyces geranii TaxID=2058923 RepID=UPI0018E50EA6|nr:hypothetical protein [Streptomyces geranii]
MADPTTTTRLRPEDRPDFEAVLRLTMSTAPIGRPLLADPTGQATARIRRRALDAADEITATTEREYAAYLALRSAARLGPTPSPTSPPTRRNTLLPALAVLTPVVAATSAAALLLLGYTLQLADEVATLPASLVNAGWVLALTAALSALAALTALLRTAIRERGGPPTADRVEQARLSWQQALLDRGMVPHLHRYLAEDPLLARAAEPPVSPVSPAPHSEALPSAPLSTSLPKDRTPCSD